MKSGDLKLILQSCYSIRWFSSTRSYRHIRRIDERLFSTDKTVRVFDETKVLKTSNAVSKLLD